jgi:hypothetical protein
MRLGLGSWEWYSLHRRNVWVDTFRGTADRYLPDPGNRGEEDCGLPCALECQAWASFLHCHFSGEELRKSGQSLVVSQGMAPSDAGGVVDITEAMK